MDSVPIRQTQTQTQVLVNSFVRSVYNWMAIGLALTGFVAYYVSNSQSMQNIIFGNPIVFYGLIIGELAMVFYLSARVNKMQASTATALFVLYAALNGATLCGGVSGLHQILDCIDILRMRRNLRGRQRLRLDHQKRPDQLRQLPVHGPYRYHHRLGGQPFPQEFGDDDDHQLHRRLAFHRSDRLRHPAAQKHGPGPTRRPRSRRGSQRRHHGGPLPLSRFHQPVLDAAADYGRPQINF